MMCMFCSWKVRRSNSKRRRARIAKSEEQQHARHGKCQDRLVGISSSHCTRSQYFLVSSHKSFVDHFQVPLLLLDVTIMFRLLLHDIDDHLDCN